MTTWKQIPFFAAALYSRASLMLRFTIAVIIIVIYGAGCAGVDKYLGSTEASYGDLNYKSTKNQENLKARFSKSPDGATAFEIETTATTPEAAIAAAMATNLEMMRQVSALFDKLISSAVNR